MVLVKMCVLKLEAVIPFGISTLGQGDGQALFETIYPKKRSKKGPRIMGWILQ